MTAPTTNPLTKKPAWLKLRLPTSPEYETVRRLVEHGNLNTVCQEARCPNQWECYANKTATFLILGKVCTRNCTFCAIESGTPDRPDPAEPKSIANAVNTLGLKHVVITSVTRDDLPDGGASIFADTIKEIRTSNTASIEVLIPDFQGDTTSLQTVLSAKPDVINHNIETVPRLYPTVRPEADYNRSLNLLSTISAHSPATLSKSGIMLGLAETEGEVLSVLEDIYKTGCRLLTLGQYLQPSKNHLPVKKYISPDEFTGWKEKAHDIGFTKVASSPFVRSSYHASEMILSP